MAADMLPGLNAELVPMWQVGNTSKDRQPVNTHPHNKHGGTWAAWPVSRGARGPRRGGAIQMCSAAVTPRPRCRPGSPRCPRGSQRCARSPVCALVSIATGSRQGACKYEHKNTIVCPPYPAACWRCARPSMPMAPHSLIRRPGKGSRQTACCKEWCNEPSVAPPSWLEQG